MDQPSAELLLLDPQQDGQAASNELLQVRAAQAANLFVVGTQPGGGGGGRPARSPQPPA